MPNSKPQDQPRTIKKKELFLEEYKKQLGNISLACQNTGICRHTYYDWLEKDEAFRIKAEEVPEIVIDFVENKLFNRINKGDTGAIIFYLKTKAKHRGYVEKQVFEHHDMHLHFDKQDKNL